jgi:hypothetical protein
MMLRKWVDAHQREYNGFKGIKDRNAFATLPHPKKAIVLGTTIRRDKKVDNGVFIKRKVLMYV